VKIKQQVLYPPAIAKTSPQAAQQKPDGAKDVSFADILQQKLVPQTVKFSAHALQRLQEREIELKPHEVEKLAEAMQKAGQKGARSTLLLYQDMAFIASVKNNTIITAVNGENLKDHVFTNIDSAVLIK